VLKCTCHKVKPAVGVEVCTAFHKGQPFVGVEVFVVCLLQRVKVEVSFKYPIGEKKLMTHLIHATSREFTSISDAQPLIVLGWLAYTFWSGS
jgi:hypothetical protein